MVFTFSQRYNTVLWKNEIEVAISLLVIFYATTLCNYMCKCMHTVLKCSIKLKLASYIAIYIATVDKWSLGKFTSAQCIHELLSVLTFVRNHLGFQNILVVNASWHLVISCNKFNSTAHRINDQRTSYGAEDKCLSK